MRQSPPPALVCTGFHRSGTSLTAKRLEAAGLSLGSHLLAAHPSNPEGHLEDLHVIGFNDAWLQRQGTSWLFHDEIELSPDRRLEERIEAYAGERDALGQPWAIKDPRVTLALPTWDDVLGNRARYLLLVRHWAECAQSLYQRHGRELAYTLPSMAPGESPHSRFWHEPLLVHQSWLAYNSRVLAFATMHPDRVALVTSRAAATLPDIGSVVTSKLGIPLELPGHGAREGLMSSKVRRAMLPDIPPWLQWRLDDLWQDLLAVCDRRSQDEDVDWSNDRSVAGPFAGALTRKLRRRGKPRATRPVAFDLHPERSVQDRLPDLPADERLEQVENAARAAIAAGRLDSASALVGAAIAADVRPGPMHMLLGEIAAARGEHELALAEFATAATTMHDRSLALRRVRSCLAVRDWPQAMAVLEPWRDADPEDPGLRLAYARCLEMAEGAAAALAALGDEANDTPAIGMQRARFLMDVDPDRGLRRYREMVGASLQEADLIGWLHRACLSLTSASAWYALQDVVCRHWRDALGEHAMQVKLGLASDDATAPKPAPAEPTPAGTE